jgi:Flp pilus assembly protein TadG
MGAGARSEATPRMWSLFRAGSGLDESRGPGRRVHRARRTRGQAVVELALILPFLLLVLLAAADLARMFNARVTISSAARAGALEAATNPDSYLASQPCNATTNRVICAVLTESSGSSVNIAPADVTLSCVPTPCAAVLGNEVRVQVIGHFQLITPALAMFTGGQAFDLTAVAAAQINVRPAIAAGSPLPMPTPTPVPTPEPIPTPIPTPTPTPDPLATPGPTASPTPTPVPTPYCASPVADFSLAPGSGKKKKTEFQFTDMSVSSPLCGLAWSWNFGDGGGSASTSTLQNPKHIYEAQGVFTVTLVVSNPGGSASRSRSVTVTP